MSTPVAAVPTVATANSNSTSAPKVAAAAGQRVKAHGLHLPATQSITLPGGLRHETLIIPASSIPSFGGYFNIDIREKNINLHNITLQFNTSTISGGTGVYIPGNFWWTRMEIVQNNNVIDTIYGNWNHIANQILFDDQDRLSTNNASGNYANATQRALLSSSATSNVMYVNLQTYFDQCRLPILTDAHNVQLRVYMDTFANICVTATGTPTATINSVNAICKVTRLDAATAAQRMNEMRLEPHHNIFHELRYLPVTIPSPSGSSNIVLSSIVGNVAAIFFTVRLATTGVGAWAYSPLTSFAILDGASTNLVGGQALPASLCANILNRDWCKSSYHAETAFAAATLNSVAVPTANNSANFYCWAFSADIVGALHSGQALSSRRMTGQEQLQLNFPSTLTGQIQVDIYALTESVIEQGLMELRKVSL